MSDVLSNLSTALAAAVETAGRGVVRVEGRRRLSATPAARGDQRGQRDGGDVCEDLERGPHVRCIPAGILPGAPPARPRRPPWARDPYSSGPSRRSPRS